MAAGRDCTILRKSMRKYLVFLLITTAMVGSFGFLLGGMTVAGLFMVLYLGMWGVVFLSAEGHIMSTYRASLELPPGLRVTFDRALEGQNLNSRPQLAVFDDPAPEILSIRSVWGDGTVLLSSGTLAALSEGELRDILRTISMRLPLAQLRLRTTLGSLALRFLNRLPQNSRELLRGSPLPSETSTRIGFFRWLRFLVFTSLASWIMNLAGFAKNSPIEPCALRKVTQIRRIWGPSSPARLLASYLFI